MVTDAVVVAEAAQQAVAREIAGLAAAKTHSRAASRKALARYVAVVINSRRRCTCARTFQTVRTGNPRAGG